MFATYFVPTQNAPRLREKLEKLSRKAVKLGCAAIMVTLAKTFSQPHPNEERAAEGERVVYEALTVHGEPPRLNGWVFAATLEHEVGKDGQPVTLLRSHGEETLPQRFRSATPDNCDHCGTVRRRNSTYLVRHEESGEWKQVGRSCLKDFLGLHQDPGALARYATLLLTLQASLSEYHEEEDNEANAYYAYDLTEYLAHTVQAIEADGWVSRSEARESHENLMPTADLVWYCLTAKTAPGAANPFKLPKPTEASYREVEAALEWVMAQDSSDNDYYHNLQMVVEMGVVYFKTAGYAASIVSSYRRAMERELRRKVLTATGNSHVGTVGKRQDMALTLLGTNVFEGYYGVTTLHRFADGEGNLVVWWASNPRVVPEDTAGHEGEFDGCAKMVEGATYKVKATVKEHGEYRGQNQTKVARVAVQPLTKPKKTRKRRARKSA